MNVIPQCQNWEGNISEMPKRWKPKRNLLRTFPLRCSAWLPAWNPSSAQYGGSGVLGNRRTSEKAFGCSPLLTCHLFKQAERSDVSHSCRRVSAPLPAHNATYCIYSPDCKMSSHPPHIPVRNILSRTLIWKRYLQQVNPECSTITYLHSRNELGGRKWMMRSRNRGAIRWGGEFGWFQGPLIHRDPKNDQTKFDWSGKTQNGMAAHLRLFLPSNTMAVLEISIQFD